MKWTWMFLAVSLHAQPAYRIVDLTAGTNYFGTPWGLNDAGDVVGDMAFQAFYWHSGRLVRPLALLSGFSTARAINNLGDIVGGGLDAHGNAIAVVIRDGAASQIPVADSTWALAAGINDRGDILINNINSTQRHTAYIWRNGNLTDIGSASYSYLSGSALDQTGRVAGSYLRPGDRFVRAFFWDSTLTDLGFLPGAAGAGATSTAYGLNAAGYVVGSSTTAGQQTHAFLWSNASGMTDLGTLAGGNLSAGLSINDAGQTVGYSALADGAIVASQRAVLWDQTGLYDLNSLIPPGSGWQLEQAISINNGAVIVVAGRRNGSLRPSLLIPTTHPGSSARPNQRTMLER